jgi:uncharacterized protein YegP (UPF0339 family)
MRTLHSLLTVFVLSLSSFAAGCATGGDDLDSEYADAESNASAPGKIDLYRSTDGQFRFRVVSGNGRTLLSSEGYASRTGALNGVLSTLDNGVDPLQYALNQTPSGRFSLHLHAANHETIAFTQAYATKASATRAITSCVNALTSYLDNLEASTTGARVEVLQGATGGFRFNLHARNGEVVLSSESYTTQAAAWNGAFAVQDAAQQDGAFALRTATDNRFYFTLTADNGQIVGMSQMYTSKAAAQDGIASVKALLAGLDLI